MNSKLTKSNPLNPRHIALAQDLGGLATALAVAQAQVEVVTEVLGAIGACPGLSRDQESYLQNTCERLTTQFLGEMLSISDNASKVPARSIEELTVKAGIWLARYIPEPDDDVLMLAESICRDLSELAQKPAGYS